MIWIKKTLLFAPLAWAGLLINFTQLQPTQGWIKTSLFAALCVYGFFRKEMYLSDGNLAKRRKFELAFVGILFLLSLGNTYPLFQFWPFIPFFLFLVWAGFLVRTLFLLTVLFVAFSHFQYQQPLDINEYMILTMSLVCSVLFRFLEKQKRSKLQKRLEAFETFENRFTSKTIDFGSLDQLQARKQSKVGELVKEQESRFEQFADLIETTFQPHTVLIYTYDPVSEKFDLQAHRSKSQDVDLNRQPLENLFKAVQSQRKAVIFQSKAETNHVPYYIKPISLASVIACPIYRNGLLTGVILVDHETKVFTRGHVIVLEKMAKSISDFMHDSETIYSYFQLKEELSSFYSASSSINQVFKLQDVLTTFLSTSRNIVPYDLAFLVMWDPATKQNRIVAQNGEFEDWIGETFSLSPSKGLISWVIENRKQLCYDGYRHRFEHSPLFHKKMKLPNVFQSVLILPIEVKEEVLGAVVYLSEKDKCFTVSIRKLLEVFSIQASIAIKNAKMVRDLEQLATTDGLTGLMNHRTFQKQLIHEIERAKRNKTSLSFVLVDLDHFKKINDNYGHPMGDFVLKEVAGFLKQSVRNVDYVARYGGEEFALILPDTTPEEALHLCQRMANDMRKKEMVDQGVTLQVTFSMGISTYPDHAMLKDQLIDFADTALYHSKRTGRNKATLFTNSLKMIDSSEKEHILINKAEKILQEQ